MRKKLLIALAVLAALAVAAVLALGYLGFVPAVSRVLGTDQPRDLGVVVTAEHLKSAYDKSGVTDKYMPPSTPDAESVKYEGQVVIKAEFTQEELTAFLNVCQWRYCPITKVQYRGHADGTVEMSGLLQLGNLEGYGRRFTIPQDRIRQGLDALKIVPQTIPFYAKGAPSAQDGEVNLGLTKVEIGRLPVPADRVQEHRGEVDALLEGIMAQVPGLSVKSADFSGGTLKFDGTYPKTQAFAP